MDNLTQTATRHLHPAKPVLYWEVRQNGVVIYRNTSIKLCQWWKKENGFLTATIHSIR